MTESNMNDPITSSQQEAAKALIDFLDKAVKESAEVTAREGHQIVFLSGPRGSGKSQILDLFHEVFTARAKGRDARISYSRPDDDLRTRICELALNRERPIFWLEPINFDQLTTGANLTAALLARLGESGRTSAQENLRYTSRLDHVSEIDRARNELTSLQNKILLALEGNATERRPYVDQDTYAIHALESERARPTIRTKLTSILTRLLPSSRGVGEQNMLGLYVVVIDDVDVRPMRAIMALQLAEFLSIPRLFFVFAGDFDTVDQTLFYQTQSEFLQMLHTANSDAPVRHDIENRANYIASSLLRKLVPPERRIKIEPMSTENAWRTKWGTGRSIESILVDRPLLRELLIPTHEENEWSHLGSEQVLHAPYRYVKDMFEALNVTQNSPPVEEIMRQRIWEQFDTIVDEDAQLKLGAQRKLKTKSKWSGLYLDVSDIRSNVIVAETYRAYVTRGDWVCAVQVSTSIRRDLRVVVEDLGDGKVTEEPLSGSTAAIYMLAHDYHVSLGKSVRGSARWNDQSRRLVASWMSRSGEVAWYRMTWPTYRMEQRFLHRWNEIVKTSIHVGHDKGASWVQALAIDFCNTILSVCGMPATRDVDQLRAITTELGKSHAALDREIYLQIAWMLDTRYGILGAELKAPDADLLREVQVEADVAMLVSARRES